MHSLLLLSLFFCRVWKAAFILLFITHKRGAQKNTGEYQLSQINAVNSYLLLSLNPAEVATQVGNELFFILVMQ